MLTSLPNILTLSRIVVIPVIVALFYVPAPWAAWTALALFILAAITDYFDGYFARVWEQSSPLGKFLDPIADKLLVAAVLFMLVGFDRIQGLSVIAAVIILLREILVSGLREYLAGLDVSLPVSRMAKWKTMIQMVALSFLILGEYGPGVLPIVEIGLIGLWIAAILTIITGWDYLRIGVTQMNRDGENADTDPADKGTSGTKAAGSVS